MVNSQRRLAWSVAPALLVLLAMAILGVRSPRSSGGDEAYLSAVYRSLTDVPYRIGDWIGVDVEVQAPAIQLLRPNKLLQRRYTTGDGGSAFSLLIVHCSDARDMQGHYPPVCYPAHGWSSLGTAHTSFALGQTAVPCTVYRFFTDRGGSEYRMTILNFFAVPSLEQSLAADMSAVNRAAASSRRSGLGAAQFQLILAGDATPEDMTHLMQEIGPAIEPAVWRIVHGVRTGSS